MPTIKLKILILLAVFVSVLSARAPQVKASTDPQSATTSATATIPATGGSTSDTESPTPPILISPPDGTVTGDNKPEFVWHQSTDPNGNTVTYTLYINGVATFLGISGTGNSAGSGYTAHLDGTQVKLKPANSLPDGSYNWRVEASDNSGNTSTSTTWHFTIDTTPPPIYLTDVDSYHDLPYNSGNPDQFEGLNFDIAGPKDVYLTVQSEPWSTITVKFLDQDNQIIATVIMPLNQDGIGYPYTHLPVGIYKVIISSFDQGGNTTILPEFQLTITQSQITIPLPDLPGLPPEYSFPYTPYSLPSLPATIAKIESRLSLTYLYIAMLAVGILALLLLIWYRKYNIIFLNDRGQYYSNIKVYHSLPTTKTSHSPIWMSKREPISYDVVASDRGRLYIRHLGRYSTLTIKTEDKTYVLSLSARRRLYTLVLS
jgi:hypothetical protein